MSRGESRYEIRKQDAFGGDGLEKLIKGGITVFWIMDILNLPCMEIFDTTYPLNGLFWLLMVLFVGFLDD